MQFANARVFMDRVFLTVADRQNVREHVAKVASSIVIRFRSMIDQLDWMTASTKKGAYNKNLVKNIAYPDWIANDSQITQYDATMNFTQTDDYLTMVANTINFLLWSQWDQLVQGAVDRTGFNGPPGITNAWYQPELNSITFPAGIFKRSFYDFNRPASVKFGAMRVIAGNELTHVSEQLCLHRHFFSHFVHSSFHTRALWRDGRVINHTSRGDGGREMVGIELFSVGLSQKRLKMDNKLKLGYLHNHLHKVGHSLHHRIVL